MWLARYTGRDGKRHFAKPTWNRGKGTFDRKADAQRAIDEAYGLSDRPDTLGAYLATWTERHPRSERTNATNEHRIGRLVDVEVEGIALKDWPLRELRRRHALVLVDHMLATEGRATTGAVGILRSLSAMAEDAITDEVCDLNPFKGIRIRASDPRAQKRRRPIRVFSFEEMHRFAKAAGRHEALVRTFTDTGMRLGEVLPLRPEDFDGETLQVRRTAHEGTVLEGTKTDHGEEGAGRVVPVPATLAWMLEAQINLNGPDCELMFTTPRGRMWRERNFYRDVWTQTQEASGLDIRPHECRHSYVTHLRADGINDADLAEIAGHRVETMLAHYTHAVGRAYGPVRSAIVRPKSLRTRYSERAITLGQCPDKLLGSFAVANASADPGRRAARPGRPRAANASQQRLRTLPRARGELDLLQLRDPFLGFDDLLVSERHAEIFAELQLEYRKEDFLVRHGVAPRRTLLFTGPPGCGKSATAEALAREFDREFAVVNLSTVVSSFLGDTSKNLSSIFEAASREPWVVLFDEFDAIGKERAERTDHGELKRVVTAFLQQLDNFIGPSILIAATNHPDLVDSAVWRRFSIVLQFDPPSVHELRDLLRLKLRSIKRESGFNVEAAASACKGLTQAEVSRVVEDSYRSHLLHDARRPLTLDELISAADAAQGRNQIATNGRARTPFADAGSATT